MRRGRSLSTGRPLDQIEPARLLLEMICKRVHGGGPGAGPRPGCEPTARGRLIAQSFGTIRVARKDFS